MIEREDPQETEKYGWTPYVVGLAGGLIIITLMFQYSESFF
jgi:hypothetical protein